MPSQDDWLNDPVAAQQRLLEVGQHQLGPTLTSIQQSNAQLARSVVAGEHRDLFGKYGPEIDLELSKIAPEFWTVDNIRTVTEMVQGRHLDEIVEERTQQRMAQAGEAGFRSDSAPAGTTANDPNRIDLNSPELGDSYRRLLQKYNVTPETLDEFLYNVECKKRGITLEQARKEWLEKAKKGDFVTEEVMRF